MTTRITNTWIGDGKLITEVFKEDIYKRTWAGLTDIEYGTICERHSAMTDFDFLEDIEAKLKEKNT